MGANANSSLSPNKCITTMALKLNQVQVTTIATQENAIIERVHKVMSLQWHAQIIWLWKKSWKARRTRRQSIWLLPSINCIVAMLLEALLYNNAGNTMPTCVWQRYDPQNFLQSKLGFYT
jgi:hypothetical protein